MKFKGWEIDVDVDLDNICEGADIKRIKSVLVSALEKLIFDCDFLPREGDLIAPDISHEDRHALDRHTYNSMDVMLVVGVAFYPNEKKIKFIIE